MVNKNSFLKLATISFVAGTLFCSPLAFASPFESHTDYIKSLEQVFTPSISDIDATLLEILKRLPPEVNLQTTEQYSYFKFFDRGIEYQGNIRVEDSGSPKLYFAYFARATGWLPDPEAHLKIYKDGPTLELTKMAPFKYRASLGGTSRIFNQLDVSKDEIPPDLLKAGETYMGEVHDDSGTWFYLIYDSVANTAAYVLDEQHGAKDGLLSQKYGVLLGQRTGYAYWQEQTPNRKRLVGVYNGNVNLNNYFDGPFDQLPDSYSGKMTIKNIYQKVRPVEAKRMDDHGNYKDREDFRGAIDAYLAYDQIADFKPLTRCINAARSETKYRNCFKKHLGF
jgi:hypothetical protein